MLQHGHKVVIINAINFDSPELHVPHLMMEELVGSEAKPCLNPYWRIMSKLVRFQCSSHWTPTIYSFEMFRVLLHMSLPLRDLLCLLAHLPGTHISQIEFRQTLCILP